MKRMKSLLILFLCVLVIVMLAGCTGDFEKVGFAGMSFSVPNNWEAEKGASDTSDGISVKTKWYHPSEEDLSLDEAVAIYKVSFDKTKYLSAKHQFKVIRETYFSSDEGYTLLEKDRVKVDGKKVRREKFSYKSGDGKAVAYVVYIPKGYSLYAAAFVYGKQDEDEELIKSDRKTFFASIDFD